MRRFLAFDIGCIECGEPSAVVGVFKTKAGAKNAADRAREQQGEEWSGQHEFVVYEIQVES